MSHLPGTTRAAETTNAPSDTPRENAKDTTSKPRREAVVAAQMLREAAECVPRLRRQRVVY